MNLALVCSKYINKLALVWIPLIYKFGHGRGIGSSVLNKAQGKDLIGEEKWEQT